MPNDSDGEVNHDAVPLRGKAVTSAITPRSAGFGSPMAAGSWTGGVSTHKKSNIGAKQSQVGARPQAQKGKPSWIDTQSEHPQQEEHEDEDDKSAPPAARNAHPQQKRFTFSSSPAAADNHDKKSFQLSQPPILTQHRHVVDSTYPEIDVKFSDPKDASPTPRPRGTQPKTRGEEHNAVGSQKTTKKKGILSFSSLAPSVIGKKFDSPRENKLTNAMRGVSAMPSTQNNKETRTRKRSSGARLPALDLEETQSSDPFDTANAPLSAAGSPCTTAKKTQASQKHVSRSDKPAIRQTKHPAKGTSRAKPPANTKTVKAKKPAINSDRDGHGVAKRTVQSKTNDEETSQVARRTRQQTSNSTTGGAQDPIIMDDSASQLPTTDDDNSDYIEQGRRRQSKTSRNNSKSSQPGIKISQQRSGEAQKRSQKDAEIKTQAQSLGSSGTSSWGKASEKKIDRVTNDDRKTGPPQAAGQKSVSSEAARTNSLEHNANNDSGEAPRGEARLSDRLKKKPVIIPFSPAGPGTNGTSRRRLTSETAPKTDRHSTGSVEEEKMARPRRPTAATENVHSDESTRSANIEANRPQSNTTEKSNRVPSGRHDNAAQNVSSSSEAQRKELHDSDHPDHIPMKDDMDADQHGQEHYATEAYIVEDDDDVFSPMVIPEDSEEVVMTVEHDTVQSISAAGASTGIIKPSNDPIAHEVDDSHQSQNHLSENYGHRITPASQLLENSGDPSPSTTAKPTLKRSMPSDEIVRPIPSNECRSSPKLEAQTRKHSEQQPIQEAADFAVERAAKRQKLHPPCSMPNLGYTLPHNKQSSGQMTSVTRPSKPQKVVSSVRHLPIFEPGGPGPSRHFVIEEDKEYRQSITRNRPDFKPAPKKEIAQQFLADINTRSNVLEQENEPEKPGPSRHVALVSKREYRQDRAKHWPDLKSAPKKDIAQQFLADMNTRSNVLEKEDTSESSQEECMEEPIDDVLLLEDRVGHQKRALAQRISEREREFEETPATPSEALVEAMHRIVGVCRAFRL